MAALWSLYTCLTTLSNSPSGSLAAALNVRTGVEEAAGATAAIFSRKGYLPLRSSLWYTAQNWSAISCSMRPLYASR